MTHEFRQDLDEVTHGEFLSPTPKNDKEYHGYPETTRSGTRPSNTYKAFLCVGSTLSDGAVYSAMSTRKTKNTVVSEPPVKTKPGKNHRRKALHQLPLPLLLVGIDVAKDHLDIAYSVDDRKATRIANNKTEIKKWLKGLPTGVALILENTGEYHDLLVHQAFEAGCLIFLVNPTQVFNYRRAAGTRAKTDLIDSYLLVEFGQDQWSHLRPYVPVSQAHLVLTKLSRQRSKITACRSALKKSIRLPQDIGLGPDVLKAHKVLQDAIEEAFKKILAILEAQIMAVIKADQKLHKSFKHLLSIPGFGINVSATSLAALGRGTFSDSNAFVGYTGLDPVACDSGRKVGDRHLSKKGDPHLRQMYYLAASAATTAIKMDEQWKKLYDKYLERWAPTQALCILARRMAVIAWCLVTRGEDYDSRRLLRGLSDPEPISA